MIPLRLALLDDEEPFRRALARLLKAHGHVVEAFASGPELLRASAQQRFSCLLLDLSIPGMSGFDVLAEWRLLEDAPPVIVISAHDEPELVRKALALGALECHVKPISARTLIAAIGRACKVPC